MKTLPPVSALPLVNRIYEIKNDLDLITEILHLGRKPNEKKERPADALHTVIDGGLSVKRGFSRSIDRLLLPILSH